MFEGRVEEAPLSSSKRLSKVAVRVSSDNGLHSRSDAVSRAPPSIRRSDSCKHIHHVAMLEVNQEAKLHIATLKKKHGRKQPFYEETLFSSFYFLLLLYKVTIFEYISTARDNLLRLPPSADASGRRLQSSSLGIFEEES
ncbi:hypothetical protein [Bacillus massilinigeriensis]|uniref:hypothetical protein n=1 Tax=Bacillus massilionigeriensis TaxID=1805475 RepID=UPI00096B5436|nr:hypothetical protein [Bacillus massilionigeriensis]